MKTAQQWHEEGKTFLNQRKFAEAQKCLDEAIKLDPSLMDAYNDKYSILFNEGKFAEVITWCDKALQNDPEDSMSLFSKGRAFYSQKQYPEALVWLDKAIEIYPNWAVPLNTKGNVLRFQGKPDEAIKFLQKSADLSETYVYPLRNISLIYDEQGKIEEALKYIEKAIERDPKDAHYLIDKGTYLKKLGRNSEALETFRKANQLYAEGSFNIDLIPTQIQWIKDTLKSLDELEKAEAEAQESIKKADQTNPVVKKLLNHLVTLKKEKEKVTENAVAKMGNNNNTNSDKTLQDEMQQLKNQFLEVQQQLVKMQAEVKDIKNEMQDVKEELANKMDDFNKKLDNELNKRDLSPENKAKIKDYFKAFIGTFSSIYVTSQVVDSGQVKLDSDNLKATALSVIASFAPFVGNILQSGIKHLNEFFQSKEMITNARKMKRIAHDSSSLSQTVGSAAYEIVLNQQKQVQILTITSEDLKKTSASLFAKIAQFCENLNDKIDVYLYSELYTSPAARLGHNDANRLVEDWIKDKVDPYEISKHFVKEATNLQRLEEPEGRATVVGQTNRSACCNMF